MKPPRLNRILVSEAAGRVSDGAGGYHETWVVQGELWADVRLRSGREAPGEGGALSEFRTANFVDPRALTADIFSRLSFPLHVHTIQPFRTYDFLPRTRRDRGNYQLNTWWNEDDKEGNFFTVRKRWGRGGHVLRILQPNPNGVIWKKLAEGEYQFETYNDLLKIAQREIWP